MITGFLSVPIFKFLVPKDRVSSSSARIFALWITVPAIIMVIISLIFLKNQTRPITNLARAAERFGKGEEIKEFKCLYGSTSNDC